MFSFFKNNSVKKLKKRHSMLCEQAMQAQRRGDIKTYSWIVKETPKISDSSLDKDTLVIADLGVKFGR